MKFAGLRPFLSSAIFLLAAAQSMAIPSHSYFPENYEIRARFRDIIFGAKNNVFSFEPRIEELSGRNSTVSLQVRRQNESFYLLFTNEEAGEYPLYSTGSYIIKRDAESGDFLQIKVFFRSEAGSFVRIYPAGNRSRMDVILMDTPVYRNVPLPMPLEQIALEPFAGIVEASAYHVDWGLLSPLTQRPSDIATLSMVTKLRALLGSLKDSDDGAMDANGVYRFIEDLNENLMSGFNCSGFTKWVVDGLYLPITGSLLPIDTLKTKHPDRRGSNWSDNYEDLRDPFFGLDWSRNLAVAIRSLRSGDEVDIEATDVRSLPFFAYVEDFGYPVDDIELILYLLARMEPGYFYIGSISREFGSAPVLKQHVHVLVLFPYFDADGRFRTVVMERNLETSIDSLLGRYSGADIHLVRIPVSESYAPPSVEF